VPRATVAIPGRGKHQWSVFPSAAQACFDP
jgi:hypothetical protein